MSFDNTFTWLGLRMHVKWPGKPHDSSVLEALPGKLDIKRNHLVFSIYQTATCVLVRFRATMFAIEFPNATADNKTNHIAVKVKSFNL